MRYLPRSILNVAASSFPGAVPLAGSGNYAGAVFVLRSAPDEDWWRRRDLNPGQADYDSEKAIFMN